jgi:hypothetical protein
MPRPWTLVVLLGLSAGTLAGCYVVSPSAYPGYPPLPPPAVPPAGFPPAGVPPATVPPSAGAPPPGAVPGPGRRCETVLVEGHWETMVRPGGQQERVWVPARNVQECR